MSPWPVLSLLNSLWPGLAPAVHACMHVCMYVCVCVVGVCVILREGLCCMEVKAAVICVFLELLCM